MDRLIDLHPLPRRMTPMAMKNGTWMPAR